MDLVQRVSDFFARLAVKSKAGIIAVSGGPDSVALLRILVMLQSEGRIGRLVAAHINHRLRGEESDADEAFVRKLADQFRGVTVVAFSIDTKSLAADAGDNLESCARNLRYETLAEIADIEEAAWVATGHTADDQAETVLHRLLRGTGLQGLCGIPERRELAPGSEVLRPLLTARRSEVLQYLEEIGQPYRVDSSNRDMRFTRNRIRHELLPQLARDYNPAIVDILCRLATQATDQHGKARAAAAELLQEVELPAAGATLVFRKEPFCRVGRSQTREAFRFVWQREGWPQGDMTFEAWERLAALADQESGAVDLPGGIRAKSRRGIIQIMKQP